MLFMNTFVERMHMEKPDTLGKACRCSPMISTDDIAALQPRYGYYVWYFIAVAICFLVLGRIASLLGKHHHFRYAHSLYLMIAGIDVAAQMPLQTNRSPPSIVLPKTSTPSHPRRLLPRRLLRTLHWPRHLWKHCICQRRRG
jgi:hypothetical protein